MYRVAICEDNAADGEHIYGLVKDILRKRSIIAQIHLFYSPAELLASIDMGGCQYDLFLLDVLMEKTNGIELAKILRSGGSQATLIFTTISRDYAIDGYKVRANDYLVKPIDKRALDASIGRVLSRHDAILVKADGMMKTVPIPDIRFAEADGHYVILQMGNGKEPIRIRATLGEAQQKLGVERFLRCHKGYLVNLEYVQEIGINSILLRSGESIPLGRQYRHTLQEGMIRYVEKAVPL